MFQKDTMMVRKRRIHRKCIATPGYYYKPLRIPLVNLEVISLSKEELTALYYADYMGVIQKLSAKKMAISQATFSRELSSARRKIAEALFIINCGQPRSCAI